MLILVLGLFVLVLGCLYFIIKNKQCFWQKMGVPCEEPTFIFGNIGDAILRRKSFFQIQCDLYNQFPDKRYIGFYQLLKPTLLIRDLELIKKITIKDFEYFEDRITFGGGEGDKLITRALFMLKGQEWKEMRCTLSPAFTSSKMRNMFTFMCSCIEKFTDYLEKRNEQVITDEFRSLFSKFTNDVIASTAFGVHCDTFKDADNEFYTMGSKAVKHFQGFQVIVSLIAPTIYKLCKFTLLPEELNTFFMNLVKDNKEQREKHNIFRPDMIHLLMEAKKGQLKHEPITSETANDGFAAVQESQIGQADCQKKDMSDEDLVAQVLAFFLAGFDAVSLLSGFMAYELAVNTDVQKKLQDEIRDALRECNGKITYEKLLAMKYLDQVVSETLRKWPSILRLNRICVREYVIPAATKDEKPLIIKPDQEIHISVSGIHRDPKYYPNPLKFDPDRFSEERKKEILTGTYLPFGIGPRNCIGSRFALLEAKVLMFHLLEKFDIVPVRQTQIPMKISKKQFNLSPEKGFWLGLKRRIS